MTAARRLLVTGGSRGIGRAVAQQAGALGWSVAINYRDRVDAADQLVAELTGAGANAAAIRADVSDAAQIAALFDQAEEVLGGLDAVVVNAGILAPLARLADMQPDRIARMVSVNLTGALLTAREAARRLPRPMDQPAAALTFMSSAAARLGSAGEFVDYAATKGGIDTLTLGLAKELAADNVRVNAVRPGLVDTDMQADSGDAQRAYRLAGAIPMGRPGTVDEVARAVIWLSGCEASYVSGALLDVAGGR